MTSVSICVPTCLRPEMIDRLLGNLLNQVHQPNDVLIVDSSPDSRTQEIVNRWQRSFPLGVLRWLSSQPGLTRQRNIGIDNISCDLICMLDDDVVLDPNCLAELVKFMDSLEGQNFGGAGIYITNEYGQHYYSYERLYYRLGIYEDLTPGKWLYCGDFIQLSRLNPFEGSVTTDFCAGCGAVYRRAVLLEIRPDSNFPFGGEDKHLGLRISQKYPLAIVGTARLHHDRVLGGARISPYKQSIRTMRNRAVILRECDPDPTWLRYLTFLGFQWIDLLRKTILMILFSRQRAKRTGGEWIGWIWNVILPPPRKS